MGENFNINPDIVDLGVHVAPGDPFANEWLAAAYVNDAYKLNLNKLLHLAPYSEVLFVSGPLGVGKTTLLQQFVISAKKSWKVVHVRASSLMTHEEFLRQVVHGFGLPLAGVDELSHMLVELGRYLQALGRSGRRAIVVIDDAHLLPDGVLAIIEQILGDERSANAISLVLGAAEAGGLSRFDKFAVLMHKLAYTLRLEPLAETDVAGYIHHRLLHSGNAALKPHFPAKVLARLYNKSGGLPGRLNELARAHLNKKSGHRGAVATGNGRTLVRGGLLLIGVAVIGAVLLFQERINQWVSMPPAKTPLAEVDTPIAAGQMEGLEDNAVVSEPAAEVGDDASGTPAGGVEDAPDAVAPPQNMGELEGQPEGPMDQTVAPQTVLEATPTAAVSTPPISTEPSVAPATVTPAPAAIAVAPVVKPAARPAKPVAKVAEKAVAKVAESGDGQNWLQSQPPQHFTLQLMALIDEPQVRQFVATHKLQGQSEVFYISRKGKRLAALVYGSYPSRAAADAAVQSLPANWGVKAPWVRTFASVFKEVKPD